MRRVLTLILVCAAAVAQNPAPAAPDASQIAQQFGPAFEALPDFPVLAADLDGDGTEDVVVVATADDPLTDEAEFHYKVVDPYSSYFGFGDPKLTMRFSVQDKPRFLLVILNWRAPKAKFVIVNLPFEKLSISRVRLRKRTVAAIRAEEISGAKSAIYWDGKKWKWKDEQMQ